MITIQSASSSRSVTDGRSGRQHPAIRTVDVVAVRFGGLLPSDALREAGLTTRTLQTLRTQGALHSIRRGVYVSEERWRGADVDERYRLRVRAAVLAAAHPPVLSHHSAAALHGLPIIGNWPATIHMSTPDARGGSSSRASTAHRGGPPDAVEDIDGCRVTSLARTLVDVAASSSLLVGVTMVDHALRVELAREKKERERLRPGDPAVRPALSKEDLYSELARVNPRTGRRRAEQSIAFASPLAANPGETLSRVRIFQLGFLAPELQVRFDNILGGEVWVDFFWRRVRKIGEFDGFLKYGAGPVLGGRDPSAVVWAEKQREDALRARVNSFDRWGWDVALSPARFHAFLTERGVPRA